MLVALKMETMAHGSLGATVISAPRAIYAITRMNAGLE